MRRTRIVERKYRGYLIKPTLTGFRVYHRGFYITECPSLVAVRERIDQLVQKHDLEKRERAVKEEHSRGEEPEQLDLF